MSKEELKAAIQNYQKNKATKTAPTPPELREAIMAYVEDRVRHGVTATKACNEIGFPAGNYYNWKCQGPKIKDYRPDREKAPGASPAVILKEVSLGEIKSLKVTVEHPILGVIALTGPQATKAFESIMKGK